MSNPTTTGTRKPRKRRKGHSQPVRFDKSDEKLIGDLQDKTGHLISVAEITRRAVRFAVPKFINGEVDIFKLETEPAAASKNGS